MKISKKFKLNKSQNELDFVDIDINKDLPLFIDPYRISKLSGPFIDKANGIINNYFSYLIELLSSKDYDEAKKVFTHLNEVNETCLGYSKDKPRGNGLGIESSNAFFEALKNSKAVELGILTSLEDIKVFVQGVSSDRISDMTTNIIRELLIEYTQNQCKIFNIPLTSGISSGMYWNPVSRKWEQKYTEMLVINGKKYLLVPKIIVTYGDRITSGDYFQHFVLNFLQQENIRENTDLVQYRKGKKNKGQAFVTKKDIRERQLGNKENKFTLNKSWLANFTNAHKRVFSDFKDQSFSQMKPVNFEEDRKKIAEYLIQHLKSIPFGNDGADDYHLTMLCILEFIFYPSISNPKKEVPINGGRKRIDIVYNNTSKEGFFYDLFDKYNIPSNFIMVECKNYAEDIKNPELDQLLGRFSKQRGKFGISTSRIAQNYKILLKRCNDIYCDSENLIIPFLDEDIIKILESIKDGNENVGEELLLLKYTQVVFPDNVTKKEIK